MTKNLVETDNYPFLRENNLLQVIYFLLFNKGKNKRKSDAKMTFTKIKVKKSVKIR
jgi:hypothetical protein